MRHRRFADVLRIVLRRHPVHDDLARGIDEAEVAVVQLQIAAVIDQPGVHGRHVAEVLRSRRGIDRRRP